jgi:hypothetical protein
MKKIIFYILAIFLASPAFAQYPQINLQGKILDSFLQNGITDCQVTLMHADSTIVNSEPKVYHIGNDNAHFTTIFDFFIPNQPGDYLIRVTKEGYEDSWGKVTVPANYKEKRLLIPTIYTRKSASVRNMGEVVVRATRIKVKMRGDTLVYDATAFNMPEGSMLSHLIEQLPGAKINENGEIFINGRKIDELTLNTRKVFGGNQAVLMENLPYFTVKELKVFERRSLQSVLTGDLNAEKEYVMDVKLKDEYALGGIANCDIAGGTHDRYLAKAFGFLLTKTLSIGAFANLNNINDETSGLSGVWGQNYRRIWGGANHPSKRKGAGLSLDYESTKKQYGFPSLAFYNTISVDRKDNLNESKSFQEFFLPTGSTYQNTSQQMRQILNEVMLHQTVVYLPLSIRGEWRVFYEDDETNHNTMLSHRSSEYEAMEQKFNNLERKKEYGISFGNFNMSLPWHKQITVSLNNLRAIHTVLRSYNKRQTQEESTTQDYRHEYQDAVFTDYSFAPNISYRLPYWKRLESNISIGYQQSRKKSTDDLFVLNNLDGWGLEDSVKLDLIPSSKEMLWHAYDPVNSTFSDMRTQEGNFNLTLKLLPGKKLPMEVTLQLPLNFQKERLAYRRDVLDTLATRNLLALNPSLRIKYKELSLRMNFQTSSPGLQNMMPYRDARNPLNIVTGNPYLKNNQKFNARFDWNHTVREKNVMKRNMRVGSDFTYYARSVAQGMTYNPQTTAYTYRPENVKGNWMWHSSHQMSFALGSKQLWWLDNELSADVWHSVDFASVEGLNEAQLNKVETVKPNETLKIRYTGKSTKATLLGNVAWRRTWGHRPSQETISTFDFSYGVNAQHTIESWHTTFNIDALMYSRRGYSSSVMNRNECVVNANISQALLHGKLILKLEGRDIFNQQSATSYEVNAQGRTESWHRILPSYIMLHAVYHFNREPKH